ncbi:MAG: hypothetical protein ACW98F_07265 [Candidatus Hodarchaeales archaeon]
MTEKPRTILSTDETAVFSAMDAGLSPKKISTELSKDEGYIRKTQSRIRKKIDKELKKAANMHRLQFSDNDILRDQGILKCFDWVINTYVFLVFTPITGILIYYTHDCSDNCQTTCRETLDLISTERGVQVNDKIRTLPNKIQYEHIFEAIRKQKG